MSGSRNRITRGQEDQLNAEADQTSIFSATGTAFMHGSNFGVEVVKDIMRKGENGGVDPEFRPVDFIERNKDRIDSTQQWRYMLSANEAEAKAMMADADDDTKAQQKLSRMGGFKSFVAQGIAGLVDIDAPLAIATGGLSTEAKLGLAATRWGRMTSGAINGAATIGAAATAGYYASPTEDWTSIPLAGLSGAAFGVLGGAMRGSGRSVEHLANEARDKALDSFGRSVNEGSVLAKEDLRGEMHGGGDTWGFDRARAMAEAEAEAAAMEAPAAASAPAAPAGARPKVVKLSDLPPQGEYPEGWVIQDGSVGAAQQPSSGPGINSVKSDRIKDIIRDATDRDRDMGISDAWYNNESRFDEINPDSAFTGDAQEAMARAAKRFHDIVTASPLVTDFGRMMRSGSRVAQVLAYDIFENSAGIIRNNRSASMLMEHYSKELQAKLIPYQDAFEEWTVRVKQASRWDRATNPALRREFDEALASEMQARKYDGPSSPRQVDPAIAKAADAVDAWSARELEISQGRPGEGSRVGYDGLTAESGYLPQKWNGRKITEQVAKHGYDNVVSAVADGYQKMHVGIDRNDARIWAQAVIDRSQRMQDGITANILGVLQADGRGALEDMLKRNGFDDGEINKLIDNITNITAQAKKPGHTKQRIDIDMRHVSSNGIRIMDLMDTDINRMLSMRSRQSAGMSALARKGIASRGDWDELVEAILQEQRANGDSVKTGTNVREKVADYIDSDKHLTKEHLEHMFSYFSGGPVGGGISPIYARMRKLTNLAVLNQLGLAQLAEFGPMIAAVGWQRFREFAGEAVMGSLKNTESELVKELKHMNVLVPEERLFRDDYTFEYERSSNSGHELLNKFDNMLNKGQRIQGYISGFYAVRNIQQRIAVTSAADRIMRNLKDMTYEMTPERMRDMGFNRMLTRKLQDYIKKGVVEFEGDTLKKLNMDKWDPVIAEDFSLVLNRVTHQYVQKALAGESSFLFHKDGAAQMFLHLKAFPMQALEKQAYRSLRLADQEAQASFMYGLLTAGVAYSIKQAVNGNTDNLTPTKIANGAFGMSNLTGWIPMWTDPLAAMLGMDSLRFNHFASRDGGAPILAVPPALSVLNRMASLPGAVQHAATGNLSTADVRAFQTIPLIGNAYGFSTMFAAMKGYAKENQKGIRKDARAQAKAADGDPLNVASRKLAVPVPEWAGVPKAPGMRDVPLLN